MRNKRSLELLRKVENFCKQYGVIGKGMGVVVACSGGVDSLTLADIFCHIGRQHNLAVIVAHFEHGIRGEVSKEDALFVKEWASARSLPFFCAAANVPQWAKEHQMSVETAARVLRYKFLREVAHDNDCKFIATAHHADDQAETVLMHLLRGAGLDGLAGISARNGDIIRPLLMVNKAQLIDYANANDLTPRTDATNFLPDAMRNKIRLELLPKLKNEYNANIVETLVRLAEVAADEREFLQRETDKVWTDIVCETDGGKRIVRKRFAKLPVALQREVLRRFFAVCGKLTDMEFIHTEAVRGLIIGGHTGNFLDLPHGLHAEVVRNSLFLR